MSATNREGGRRLALMPLLARQLDYGTWLASFVIAFGMAVALFERSATPQAGGTTLVSIGIGLVILQPVIRVILMGAVFVFARDYRHAAIAGIVLVTIGIAAVVGLALPA